MALTVSEFIVVSSVMIVLMMLKVCVCFSHDMNGVLMQCHNTAGTVPGLVC